MSKEKSKEQKFMELLIRAQSRMKRVNTTTHSKIDIFEALRQQVALEKQGEGK